YSPKLSRSVKPHSPVVTPALAQSIEAGMMLRFSLAAARSSLRAAATAFWSRALRHALRRSICSASACGETVTIASAAPASGGDRRVLAGFDGLDAAGVRFHELMFHIALLDGGDCAAERRDVRQLLLRLAFESLDLGGNCGRAVENVAVFEQVGLVGEDLLHAQRPLLVPGPRQAERFVPGWQLHRSRAGAFRQRHSQHLDENSSDVVLRLLLGQPERVDLHAIAEQPLFGIVDAVALGGDLVPELGKGAHLAQLGDEA